MERLRNSFRTAASHERQDDFDPDYLRWRAQELKSWDDDYRLWCNDRYLRFTEEFATWRRNRALVPSGDAPGGGVGRSDPSQGSAHITGQTGDGTSIYTGARVGAESPRVCRGAY
jgi:hypothetical protein